MTFVVAGALMLDVIAAVSGDIRYGTDTPAEVSFHSGGAAANLAHWMAFDGEHPHLYCVVGEDVAGTALVNELEDAGVIVHARRVHASTGAVIALVDGRGERTMLPNATANSGFETGMLADALHAGDHLHVSGYILLNEQSRPAALEYLAEARRVGATTSIDPSSSGPIRTLGPERMLEMMRGTDLLLANEEEAEALTGETDPAAAAHALLAIAGTVIVKLGAEGALLATAAGTWFDPALPVDVIDTVGAGDAFGASAIVAWKAGNDPRTVLRTGNGNGARCVAVRGARPPAL